MPRWLLLILTLSIATAACGQEAMMEIRRPARDPGLFQGHSAVILTDDSQLETIAKDPSAPLFSGEGRENYLYPPETSLLTLLDQAKQRGSSRFMVSYDFFFGGKARRLFLDSPETLAAYEVIAKLAKERGMTIEGSVINPLDLGRGYAAKHDQAGEMCLFREGAVGTDGRYDLTLEAQAQWANNKGPIPLTVKAVKVFAFPERAVPGTPYFAVDPDGIVDVSKSVTQANPVGEVHGSENGWRQQPYRVAGRLDASRAGWRMLVVLVHALPDMDYFSKDALAYAKGVIDEYHRRGIDFGGFYGDEMHSQFDWDLGRVGPEELQVRYVTPSMGRAFGRRYGREYADLYKLLVYFAQGHDGVIDGAQHVMGADRAAIARTWLFRRNYFDFFSQAVTGLALEAKRYAERLYGRPVEVTAHPTWQEAPTCDNYGSGCFRDITTAYDYSDRFAGSASVREAISACYNYFHWNRVYTGCGTDHIECGWADRNYFGRAFGCSLGLTNDAGWAYTAHWGSPGPVAARINQVTATYGCRGSHWMHNRIQGEVHRDTDVLLLYPLDLLYADQRFGSWMVQYGYCDYITEEDLARWGRVTADGQISVRGRRFRVLGALYEPFVRPTTLRLMQQMLTRGGRVLWMAAPPELLEEAQGPDPLAAWQEMFGVRYRRPVLGGVKAGGRQVDFTGPMAGVEPMTVASSLLPDWLYPVTPEGATVVARAGSRVVGAVKDYPGGGRAMYLGFRARDDQSRSTGRDIHTLFDCLAALGAYQGDSHPERVSRLGSVVANRFPNGVVTLARHWRHVEEQWPGGFKRDPEEDKPIVERLNLPTEWHLEGLQLDGHTITYHSPVGLLSYAVEGGRLAAFCGEVTTGLTLDGVEYKLVDHPLSLAWGPISANELAPGVRRAYWLWVSAPTDVRLPLDTRGWQAVRAGVAHSTAVQGSVKVRPDGDWLVVTVAAGQQGTWLYVGDW